MKRNIILVVDYGTSNVRVNAIDAANGGIQYSSSKKYLVENKGKGYAEISSKYIWDYSVDCMRAVMEQFTEEDEAKAIAYSFFGDNLIPVDKDGNALNDCILCTDIRGQEEVDYINSQIPAAEQIDIIGDTYMLFKFGAKALWVKNNMPEIVDKLAYYDTQQQYVFRKLGLKAANDYTMAARKQVCNLNGLTWSKRFLDVMGITEESLGTDIVATDAIVGYVKNYGDVTFTHEIPVIAGGHDCDVGMIGMGIIDENVDFVGDITGTFDHVGYLANGIVNIAKDYPEVPLCSYNGPLENTTICLGAIPTAGATLEWFMREINGSTSQEEYTKYWNSVKFDGKGTVMVYPTLEGNQGRIEGFGVTTTKADLFKAIIEALTFENRRLIENCQKIKSDPITRVRIGGGVANSDEWMQLRADISGRTIERMSNIQISSLGGAVLAAVRIGLYSDLREAVEHMVHVKDTFTPHMEVHKEYERLYQTFLEKMGYK